MGNGTHPWWRFGFHAWKYGANEDARNAARAEQDATSLLMMGTFEARETRECKYCGRFEQRDIYGGNFIPYGWVLRAYRP